MRISQKHHLQIKYLALEIFGEDSTVLLFGSRVDDSKKGGDVDLLVETRHAIKNPALLSARFSARVSRLMNGRKVDVILAAPNVRELSIHKQARSSGMPL